MAFIREVLPDRIRLEQAEKLLADCLAVIQAMSSPEKYDCGLNTFTTQVEEFLAQI